MELAFLSGFGIGLSIAAPVGPIGALCIRQSLTNGARVGLFCGLGAAVADGFYGGVAAFGLTAVAGILQEQEFVLRLIAGELSVLPWSQSIFCETSNRPR
jgi:threonine/homoserine/homoserine lactone efflux protein